MVQIERSSMPYMYDLGVLQLKVKFRSRITSDQGKCILRKP